MRLISVNVSRAEPIRGAKSSGVTGIFKHPVPGPASITLTGLAGDAVCDTDNHGGPDQAVYVYGTSDYAWWSAALRRELEPGTFGENLTIGDLESAGFRIGDRLSIGPVVLEVTASRIPCATLAARMGDPSFVKRFRYAECPGLYCRVNRTGSVRPGDPVIVEPYAGETITILEDFRHFFDPHLTAATVGRHLAAPIASRSRADMETRLRKLQGAALS